VIGEPRAEALRLACSRHGEVYDITDHMRRNRPHDILGCSDNRLIHLENPIVGMQSGGVRG
jgi:hypothetical protein